MNWVFLCATGGDFDVATPLLRSLGGTESAMCYLAAALARQGQSVATLTGTSQPRVINGVHCLNLNDVPSEIFSPADAVTVVVGGPADLVRSVRAVVPRGRPVIFWTGHAHDQPLIQELRDPQVIAACDKVIGVSQWHVGMLQQEFSIPTTKLEVLRYAISPSFVNMFADPTELAKHKSTELRLAYTSTPFRGLQVLVACFPLLYRHHPDCYLDVFSSMQVYGPGMSEDPYQEMYEQCRSTPGIRYRGSLAQKELATELRASSILAYPNTFAETGCIAVMEAMAAGLMVVTSDLGALPETCSGWARLIAPISDTRTPEVFAIDFLRHLDQILKEYRADKPRWLQQRFNQSREFSRQCNWDIRAAQWTQSAQRWLDECRHA